MTATVEETTEGTTGRRHRPHRPRHRTGRGHRVPDRLDAGDLQRARGRADPERRDARRSSSRSPSTSATAWCAPSRMQPTDGLVRGCAGDRHRRVDHRARGRRDARQGVQHHRRLPQPRGGRDARRQGAVGHPPQGRRRSTSWSRRPRCSRPASRSSTCSRRTSRAARSACSVEPASARPCSSRR